MPSGPAQNLTSLQVIGTARDRHPTQPHALLLDLNFFEYQGVLREYQSEPLPTVAIKMVEIARDP